ncbi:sensor histidine kinase [Deinococcus pimensis]|uniref:sensor histidine kinase n=1 Tax=Deinococcus pimensis TaxID=309888 RepID=UPI0004AE3BE7|nr:HAMP domain-containing sensor histidine kinase [Deinococcus pimensis]
MWHTLAFNLTLAFVLVAALALGAVGLISWSSTRAQFTGFVQDRARDRIVTQVQGYVEATGSVAGFRPLPGEGRGPTHGARPQGAMDRGSFVVLDPSRRAVYALPDLPAGTVLTGERAAAAVPVEVNGQLAGYVAPTGVAPSLDPQSERFLARTTGAILWAMLGAALVAVLLGVLLARMLLAPMRNLRRGIRGMQRGEAPGEAPRARVDEFGEVLTAFYEMHGAVVRNQRAQRELTANVAHDLNTPLSVIGGTLEGMLDGTFRVTPERLARLQRETRHVSGLVGDLRFLSLADAGELNLDLREENLNLIVNDAVGSVRDAASRSGVALHVTVPEGALGVTLDARQVTRVLRNLLDNALAYTPEGGRVHVTVRRDDDVAVFSVEDTGVGIDVGKLPFVFDRLYRADEARVTGGSGLGLTIVRSVVEAHGGHVAIESTPGVGTTVTVALPLVARKIRHEQRSRSVS